MAGPQVTDSATSKRVVAIAIDGSEHSRYAFNFYVKNIHRVDDKVYFIHAVEIDRILHSTTCRSLPWSVDRAVLAKLIVEEKEKIEAKLQEFAQWLKDARIDGTVKAVHAETPGEGLCKVANEINASMILIGTRGLGTIRRSFSGSVSDYVLYHANVPVFVCHNVNDDLPGKH